MIYQWKLSPSQFPVSAQVAGECLEALRVRSNGHLTPRAVVDEARPEDSPLHPGFEWNDAAAAEAYRETQAKDMLRSIVVQLPQRPDDARPTRAFVSVEVERSPVYTSIDAALSDDSLRAQVIARAWSELRAWRERHKELEDLADLFAEIDRTEARLGFD